MNLKARIKRLEAKMEVGKPCALCRLHVRQDPQFLRPQAGDEVLPRICSICGDMTILLIKKESNLDDWNRDLLRNISQISKEDLWVDKRRSAILYWYELAKSLEEYCLIARYKPTHHYTKPVGKGAKLYDQLVAQAEKESRYFEARMNAKYGEAFPEHEAIMKAARQRANHQTDEVINVKGMEEQELGKLEAMVQFELIIWGQVLEPTREMIKGIKQKQRERAERAHRRAAEERRREEAARREEEERAAEEERRRAEAEAELAARLEQEAKTREFLAMIEARKRQPTRPTASKFRPRSC